MLLVRLTDRQQKRRAFTHPLMQNLPKFDPENDEGLICRAVAGDVEAQEELFNTHLIIGAWLISRYLGNWSDADRFLDDMVSECVLAIWEQVSGLTEGFDGNHMRHRMVLLIKKRIESFLNNNMYIVNASLSTNQKRLQQNKPIEAAEAVEFSPVHDGLVYDNADVCIVDAVDSFERLYEADSEEIIDLVYQALQNKHGIYESNLSKKQKEKIRELAKLISE